LPGAQRARWRAAGEASWRIGRSAKTTVANSDAQRDQQDPDVDLHRQIWGSPRAQRDEQRQAEIGDRRFCCPPANPRITLLKTHTRWRPAGASAARWRVAAAAPARNQHQVRDVRARDQQQQAMVPIISQRSRPGSRPRCPSGTETGPKACLKGSRAIAS
jgi:hypothetical protein